MKNSHSSRHRRRRLHPRLQRKESLCLRFQDVPTEQNISRPPAGSAVLGRIRHRQGPDFQPRGPDHRRRRLHEGTVELQEHRLTVGPNGKVLAGVKAREIVVLGTIHGNVETTDKIDIRKDGKLVGDIKTARVVIEDGAYFKGNIDIVRAEVPKPQPAPAPKPQPVASAPPAPATGAHSVAAVGGGDLKR